MNFNSSKAGFGIIEIVVSAAMFLLFVTAFVGVIIHSGKQIRLAEKKSKAVLLAEEGWEAVRSIRDEDFNNLTDGDHGLAISSGNWDFLGTNDSEDVFTRTIAISSIDSDTKEISSEVVWDSGLPTEGSVEVLGQLTNWRESVGQPVDSCSSFCQSLTYSSGTCRQNTNQCRQNSETYESSGNQYCTAGPSADTCCCAP